MIDLIDTFMVDGDNVSKLMFNSLSGRYFVVDANGNLEVPPGPDMDQVIQALHTKYGVDPNEPI